MALVGAAPIGVVFDQFDIEPIEAAGRADVKGAFADLFNGGNARERQEEAEVIGKIDIATSDGFAGTDILGLKINAIGGEDEFCLGSGGGRAGFEGVQGRGHRARCAGRKVNIAGLKDAADVGFVGGPGAQALDRRLLVAENHTEGIGEFDRVKGLFREFGNGLFNFNGVHAAVQGLIRSMP